MGCIPVLIADYTVYPYHNLLDYSRFAVFMRETEIPIMEDILYGYSIETLKEMQLALKIVRNAFIYFSTPDSVPPKPAIYGALDLAAQSLRLIRLPKSFSRYYWTHARNE